MKSDQIYIGNIMSCTSYKEHITFGSSLSIGGQEICSDSFGYIEQKSEIYKENAILLKLKNGGFVDLDNLNTFFDHISVKKRCTKDGFYLDGIIMSTSAHKEGCLFVDSNPETLHMYEPSNIVQNISVHQFKKKMKKNSTTLEKK